MQDSSERGETDSAVYECSHIQLPFWCCVPTSYHSAKWWIVKAGWFTRRDRSLFLLGHLTSIWNRRTTALLYNEALQFLQTMSRMVIYKPCLEWLIYLKVTASLSEGVMTSLRVIFLVILFSTFISNSSNSLGFIRKYLKNHGLLHFRKSLMSSWYSPKNTVCGS